MRTCRVVITDDCNLDCDYCCMKDFDTHNSFKSKSALAIASAKFDEVSITGGEPLLEMQKLIQFVSLIKYFRPDTKVYLYTNGVFLNNDVASMLAVAGVDGINWSPKTVITEIQRQHIAYIHACLVPVRIRIQDIMTDDILLHYALSNGMQVCQWTIDDCYKMPEENRYRIDWNII